MSALFNKIRGRGAVTEQQQVVGNNGGHHTGNGSDTTPSEDHKTPPVFESQDGTHGMHFIKPFVGSRSLINFKSMASFMSPPNLDEPSVSGLPSSYPSTAW